MRREVNYMLKLFTFIQTSADSLRRREEGQTMAEYGVVLAVITLAVIGAITLLSTTSGAPSRASRTSCRNRQEQALFVRGPFFGRGPFLGTAAKERTPVKLRTRRKIEIGSEKGQSLTEFALALPILALLLFAVIQFGIVFNNYVTLVDATRAGARKRAVGREQQNPASAVTAEVRASARDLTQSNLNVTVTSTWQPASDVTVTATYPYSISLLGMVVKSGRISSSTTERVE